jgi:hypothetical protein
LKECSRNFAGQPTGTKKGANQFGGPHVKVSKTT